MPPHGPRSWVVLLVVFAVVLTFGLQTWAPPKLLLKLACERGSFIDHLTGYHIARSIKAGGWNSGSPFDNPRNNVNILFGGHDTVIHVDDVARLRTIQTPGCCGYNPQHHTDGENRRQHAVGGLLSDQQMVRYE